MSSRIDKKIVIYQGDTSPVVEFSSPSNLDLSSVDWTGSIVVRATKCNPRTGDHTVTGGALITKVLEKATDNTMFLAWLEPAETQGLPPGVYIWVVEITNLTLTPALNVEEHMLLTIEEQGA
jgi:hypothetical protein